MLPHRPKNVYATDVRKIAPRLQARNAPQSHTKATMMLWRPNDGTHSRPIARSGLRSMLYLGRSASTDMGLCIGNGVGPDTADDIRDALQRPKAYVTDFRRRDKSAAPDERRSCQKTRRHRSFADPTAYINPNQVGSPHASVHHSMALQQPPSPCVCTR